MTIPAAWRIDGTDPLRLAEAVGLAWVAHRDGGVVHVVDPVMDHPWWPVLRAWLPADAPLVMADHPGDGLPCRPFPPVALESLPRSGVPPFPMGSTLDQALIWLQDQEPRLCVVSGSLHPAEVLAWAAVAAWGWVVVWRASGWDPGLESVLTHIGRRGLPLTVILPEDGPDRPIHGWWVSRAATRWSGALVWHLSQRWPGMITGTGSGGATAEDGAWLPG